VAFLGLSLAAGACAGEHGGSDVVVHLPSGDSDSPGGTEGKDDGTLNLPPHEKTILDERKLSYTDALRTASLKLTDRLPTLAQIKTLDGSEDPEVEYNSLIDAMFEKKSFSRRMIRWWRDVLRQGGGDLDSAPMFAARIVVEGRPFGEMFTATSNTCPTFDGDSGQFVDGDCDNGVTTHAGVLTNPGSMKQFYANMAFRRVRWVQEIFACSKFPSEQTEAVTQGEGQYSNPWPFESVATDPIDFQDTSSVVCANCHASMNRLAPLFAYFDDEGQLQDTIQVMTPTAPDPQTTELSHWLADGEDTAWRHGVPVDNLTQLGEAMAADPDVQKCIVARLWNFTMSKEDIVSDLATVPVEVIAPFLEAFGSNGNNIKETMKLMFKSPDFVRY